jgi:hypothetical protein
MAPAEVRDLGVRTTRMVDQIRADLNVPQIEYSMVSHADERRHAPMRD